MRIHAQCRGYFSTSPACERCCHKPKLGVILHPLLFHIRGKYTNSAYSRPGHTYHARHNTHSVVQSVSCAAGAHKSMMQHIECRRQSREYGIEIDTTRAPIETLARACCPSHTSTSQIQQAPLDIEAGQQRCLPSPTS
jgi:hypothetical protein